MSLPTTVAMVCKNLDSKVFCLIPTPCSIWLPRWKRSQRQRSYEHRPSRSWVILRVKEQILITQFRTICSAMGSGQYRFFRGEFRKGHDVNRFFNPFRQSNPNVSWGQSAGAISVGLHLLFDGGNTGGLFSGAIMV